MNRVLAYSIVAALGACAAPPLSAGQHHFGGVPMGRMPQGGAPALSFSAPRSFAPVRSFATVPRTSLPTAPITRSFRGAPAVSSRTFAFTGHAWNPGNQARVVSPGARYTQPGIHDYRDANRFARATVPFAVTRDWDRHHDHFFHHHHFRFLNNAWVVLDDGFYDDAYPYYSYDDYLTPYAAMSNADDHTGSLGAEVQEALAAQGYYHGAIDGDVGPMTRNAIATYQRVHRLPMTGTITTSLLDSLDLD